MMLPPQMLEMVTTHQNELRAAAARAHLARQVLPRPITMQQPISHKPRRVLNWRLIVQLWQQMMPRRYECAECCG